MAHAHGPPHPNKQPDRGWLVACFYHIQENTHPTYDDLASSATSTTNMETNGNCDVFFISYEKWMQREREKCPFKDPPMFSTRKWVWRFT